MPVHLTLSAAIGVLFAAISYRHFGDGLVLMILNLADGPKLNGPFVPLAVGAYIMAWGTMGVPFDGASMNPARSFGPDLALGNLSTWWIYLISDGIRHR